jgi:antitoxin FitA
MKTIQIRGVPDELHRSLKVRAAQEGTTLSELALTELRRSLERPSRSELLDRIATRNVGRGRLSPTAMLRAERDAR